MIGKIGAITQQIDVAQLVLYTFWLFFLGLVFYLRREDKREGYPLNAERNSRVLVQGFPWIPKPKVYRLHDGRTVIRPRPDEQVVSNANITARGSGQPGAPVDPVGNPLLSGIGPAAWAERADVPDTEWDGSPKIVPLSQAPTYNISAEDEDPRELPVIGNDGVVAGHVTDLWIDRSEIMIRYLEVALEPEFGGRRVLLPRTMADLQFGNGVVKVRAILGQQFADVPATKSPTEVTLLEEDKIMAYYGSGNLFATPERREPLL